MILSYRTRPVKGAPVVLSHVRPDPTDQTANHQQLQRLGHSALPNRDTKNNQIFTARNPRRLTAKDAEGGPSESPFSWHRRATRSGQRGQWAV